MKITTITYQKTFPLAPYVNEKIGIEVELDADENPERVFSIAKETVERWHKDNKPQLAYELSQLERESSPYSVPIIQRKEAVKLTPDKSIRQQFAIAIAQKDKDLISQLEEMYDFTLPTK